MTPLPAAEPIHLEVPAIGASSDLLQLGQNPDGTVEVPPLARDSKAGWYRKSPTPGELGPSVLLGHVDSAEYGPGVFFKLGALRPGDTVSVTRADHTWPDPPWPWSRSRVKPGAFGPDVLIAAQPRGLFRAG